MGDKTNIEWTSATWNPVRGCSVISPGCKNCYAMRQAIRQAGKGEAYEGLVRSRMKLGPVWTGKTRLVKEHLDDPLRWTKPRRIFVNSMSDLFHETLTNEEIAAVFGVMAASPQHTFQVLTKRAERMREWFEWLARNRAKNDSMAWMCIREASERIDAHLRELRKPSCWQLSGYQTSWPLPNVWLGVSVENQEYADERVPDLLATPAVVRFVSYEPALGPVDFGPWLVSSFDHCPDETDDEETDNCRGCPAIPNDGSNGGDVCSAVYSPKLDWIIVGGESGPGARPFDIAWARSVVEQCKSAGVACFVKQLGAHPFDCPTPRHGDIADLHLKDRKGGDMSEWPEDLRVRQFPEVRP